jgi:hypothetical protein
MGPDAVPGGSTTLMLTSLENSALSQWLLGSNSIWAYPTVLTLHTFGMMVLVGAALMLDLRLLGFGRGIPLGSMRTLFRLMWIAFWLNAVTGSMLFAADATKRGTSVIFLVKLLLVALGVVTIVLIRRNVYGANAEPVTVSGTAKLLAIASILVWTAAITTGRLLAYVA